MKIFGRNFSDHPIPEADHAWMDRMVREIRQHLPRMLREHPQRGEFWDWFCGEVDSLFRHVRRDEDRLYFQDFINKTLEDAGLEERLDLTRRADDPACAQQLTPQHSRRRSSAHPPAASVGLSSF
ncbi:MAG TPA: hypothetical protein VIT22_05465 [Pseudoxanthomonas sp.]